MKQCPCGSGLEYTACCEPYITLQKQAETAEKMLRSRFTAHVVNNIDYIMSTVHPDKQEGHDAASIKEWCENTKWKDLEIIEQEKGQEGDDVGYIEFKAQFTTANGAKDEHHEKSEFKKIDGKWYFYEGTYPKPQTYVRETPKVGRNEPCPCGSGKKYKKCCGK